MPIHRLGEDVDHVAQQVLAEIHCLQIASFCAGDKILCSSIFAHQLGIVGEYIAYRFGGNALLAQQSTGTLRAFSHHAQDVIGVHTYFIAGVCERKRVINQDDGAARKRHLPVSTGNIVQITIRIAPAFGS